MTRLLVIGCGGFLGAIARYGLTLAIQNRANSNVPFGTMAVNVLGCFLLGLLTAYLSTRPDHNEHWSLFLRVGLLGAFTTFSTLGIETVELLTTGEYKAGLLSLFGNLLLGGVAVVFGGMAGRALG
jgi:CrcB protein